MMTNLKRKNTGYPNHFQLDSQFEEKSTYYLKQAGILNKLGVKEIVEDTERQLKGIDLIADVPLPDGTIHKNAKIDIKSIASQLSSFCFELRGSEKTRQTGWFLNNEVETDYYLLVYHTLNETFPDDIRNSYSKAKSKINSNSIGTTEYLLIPRQNLKEVIVDSWNLNSIEDLKECIPMIETTYDESKLGSNKVYVYNNKQLDIVCKQDTNFYITYSINVYEKPINLVVKKTILNDIASIHETYYDEKPIQLTLKDLFRNESQNMTPWMAHHSEIIQELIQDASYSFYEKEMKVLDYRIDDAFVDKTKSNLVIVENQFGKSDHTHTTQVMLYADQTNAKTTFWFADDFDIAHQSLLNHFDLDIRRCKTSITKKGKQIRLKIEVEGKFYKKNYYYFYYTVDDFPFLNNKYFSYSKRKENQHCPYNENNTKNSKLKLHRTSINIKH